MCNKTRGFPSQKPNEKTQVDTPGTYIYSTIIPGNVSSLFTVSGAACTNGILNAIVTPSVSSYSRFKNPTTERLRLNECCAMGVQTLRGFFFQPLAHCLLSPTTNYSTAVVTHSIYLVVIDYRAAFGSESSRFIVTTAARGGMYSSNINLV